MKVAGEVTHGDIMTHCISPVCVLTPCQLYHLLSGSGSDTWCCAVGTSCLVGLLAVGSQSPTTSPIAGSRNALSSVSRRLNNTQYCAIEITVYVSSRLPILGVQGIRREDLQSRIDCWTLMVMALHKIPCITKRAPVWEITSQSTPSWK